MIKETQPARQRYVKNGVDYPYISSSVRGKDLKKKRRHVNDKRTRWMSISSDLSFGFSLKPTDPKRQKAILFINF